MRRFLLASSLLIISGSSFAESTVTVPWTEFRGLYAEQIKRKLEGTKTDDELPPLYTIEQAFYQLTVTDKGAAGRVQVAGRVLQGEPDPLPLFGHDIAVNDVKELSGGRLIANEQGYDLFVGDEKAFRVVLDVSVPMRREELSRYIEFSVPRSVQNVLELSLPSSLRLSAAGAMQQTDGRYYFSPTDALTLRFEDLVQSKAGELSLDSFTQFELQGGRLVATHFFVPTQSVNVPVQISLDPSGGGFGTSLSTEWIESRGDEKIIATLPSNWLEPFIIQQEFSVSTDAIDFRLPRIEGNAGQEGNIQIKQAVDARIQMLNPQLTQAIPAQQLSAGVRAYASVSDTYSQVPIGPEGDGRRVQIQVEWLEAVSTPEIVLDAVHFHTSFADNGDALTALHLTLPADAGDQLELNAIPDAQIWSLQVNGESRNLYTHEQGKWIIPLPENTASIVELSFLQSGQRLGLEGRLDLTLPATGLVARRVNLTIGLSSRLDLIAMDSDLDPAVEQGWPRVDGFTGVPYFFTRPFYRGAAVPVSIYYKEPIGAAPEGQS